MKVSRFLTVIAAAAISVTLLGSSVAQADIITKVKFDGTTSGIVRTLSDGVGSVYMGPYGIQAPIGTTASLWMCFNALVDVSSQSWSALSTDTAGVLAGGYYADPAKVKEVAWLANLWGGSVTAPGITYGLADINEALWYVMNGVVDLNRDNRNTVNKLVGLAEDYVITHNGTVLSANFLLPGTGDGANWKFDANVSQPFVQPVPEPGTLLLLGTGLIGAAGFSRRFFRRK